MTHDNDRLNDDPDPYQPGDDVHGTDTVSLYQQYRMSRVPTSRELADLKYRTDPTFHQVVDLAVDRPELPYHTPQDIFEECPGSRIRASRAHLGEDIAKNPPQVVVEVVDPDHPVAALNEWADDPVSAYASRDVPHAVRLVADAVEDEPVGGFLQYAIDDYRSGDLSRAGLEAKAGDIVYNYDIDLKADLTAEGGTDFDAFDDPTDLDLADLPDTPDRVPRAPTSWQRAVLYVLIVLATVAVLYWQVAL